MTVRSGSRFLVVILVLLFAIATRAYAQTKNLRLVVNLSPDRPEYEAYYTFIAKEFEAHNPGVHVIITPRATDWRTKTPIEIASGIGPDVMILSETAGPAWAISGCLLNLIHIFNVT